MAFELAYAGLLKEKKQKTEERSDELMNAFENRHNVNTSRLHNLR